ncbi:sodium:proton antiporter [Saccharicrinis sp. FJH54]|uniref:sodium:proton antiporter n=1 Tax=Saccharicrinis sp. FJH54 TaxID=3344665 RepID=UPI0035D51073
MKRLLLLIVMSVFMIVPQLSYTAAQEHHDADEPQIETLRADTSSHVTEHNEAVGHYAEDHHASEPAAPYSVLPFILLLLMIATGPLFYEHFWHRNYPRIAIILAALVVLYYIFGLGNTHAPIHAFFEYFQFIALLSSLYIASGGIMISVDRDATPKANVTLLIIGSIIANIIGTTGASMLLIRPYIRLNEGRIKAYHIVFFIFMVSNVGGNLTPIGDPPLFLGFLKGVPFFWTLKHNFMPWVFATVILAVIFYLFDRRNKEGKVHADRTGKIRLIGTKNFIWLLIVVLSVFIDPNIFDWVPGINYHGQKLSFIRELIMLSVGFFSYKFASKEAHKGNGFDFEPILEVTYIFIGIFGTMMPALELVGNFASSDAGQQLINPDTLYFGTGTLSAFLDNAPTYLNFLAAAMASKGADLGLFRDVQAFAGGEFANSILSLRSISVAAVFFGAMSYIGNGPNFMVKSIAEQSKINMPSFFGYMIKYSIPVLLPILFLTWVIFIHFNWL